MTKFSNMARAAVAGAAVAAVMAAAIGTAPAGAAPTGTGPEPVAETAGCSFGTWPADAEGQPAGFQAGAAAGVYLWHTDGGWRLRVTHPGTDKVVFRGTITSTARIHGVERRTESRDAVIAPGPHRVGFRFTNYGRIDGLDFRMGCGAGFGVDVSVNGRRIPADHVFIGADGHHPAQVPLRVTWTA